MPPDCRKWRRFMIPTFALWFCDFFFGEYGTPYALHTGRLRPNGETGTNAPHEMRLDAYFAALGYVAARPAKTTCGLVSSLALSTLISFDSGNGSRQRLRC